MGCLFVDCLGTTFVGYDANVFVGSGDFVSVYLSVTSVYVFVDYIGIGKVVAVYVGSVFVS